MKLNELLNSASTSLPRGGYEDARETFDEFLEKVFESYLNDLSLLDDPEYPDFAGWLPALIDGARQLSQAIAKAVRATLTGQVHSAYVLMSKELTLIDWGPFCTELGTMKPPLIGNDPFTPYAYATLQPSLYRIRKERLDYKIPDRGEIFHVPFEKRRLIGNQRYSVPGLPCLYLGSSVWICWEELGRPPLDTVWVSRFRIEKPISVLDFQFSPSHLGSFFEALGKDRDPGGDHEAKDTLRRKINEEFVGAYLRCWPLFAACSISREQRVGSFVPEFIVPQLLLQWVAQEGHVDGIRYFSVRTPIRGSHLLAHSNCVFPVKTVAV